MYVPVCVVLSVIRSITGSVCETDLPRDSYACCINPGDVASKGLTNCSFFYRHDQCKAGDHWDTPAGGSCGQYNQLRRENWERLLCKGVHDPEDAPGVLQTPGIAIGNNVEDPSTYDNFTFLWSCSKPPPPAKEAKVLLDPPAGNIAFQSYRFYLNVTLEKNFPEAVSSLDLPNGCLNMHRITDETGLVTKTCQYQITLWERETNFTLRVYQPGFTNKTFQYKATTTVFPSGASRYQRTIAHHFCLSFLTFYFYVKLK